MPADASVSLAKRLWTPAPASGEESLWAGRPARQRFGAALLATLVVAGLILVLFPLRSRIALPGLRKEELGALRSLVLMGPMAVVVGIMAWRWIGSFEGVGLGWRGAGVSLLFSAPMIALVLVDSRFDAVPRVQRLILTVSMAAAVGCTEELLGRGLLVTLLGGRRHALAAVVGSSVLFAYLHLPGYWQTYGFRVAMLRCASSAAFSAVFALIRLRSGSLAGPIVFHVIDDAQHLFQTPSAAPPGEVSASIFPFLRGCGVSALYWLVCRGAIARSTRVSAVPAAADA